MLLRKCALYKLFVRTADGDFHAVGEYSERSGQMVHSVELEDKALMAAEEQVCRQKLLHFRELAGIGNDILPGVDVHFASGSIDIENIGIPDSVVGCSVVEQQILGRMLLQGYLGKPEEKMVKLFLLCGFQKILAGVHLIGIEYII